MAPCCLDSPLFQRVPSFCPNASTTFHCSSVDSCTKSNMLRLAKGPKLLWGTERVVCRGASRAKQGASSRASIERLHALAAPPSPSTTHYVQRAHKQGWNGNAGVAEGGLRWRETVEMATDTLTADRERHAWTLSVREITRLATTTSKLAKASKGARKAPGAGSAGSSIAAVQQLLNALAGYAQHAPVLEAADPSAWCVLLHGLVSASQVLPGAPGSARAKLCPLLMRAAACLPGPQDWLAWSPSHNPSLRPQTLSSLMWAFAVLGYKLHGSSGAASAGLRENAAGMASATVELGGSSSSSSRAAASAHSTGAAQHSVVEATARSRDGGQASKPVSATVAVPDAAGAPGFSSERGGAPQVLLLHLVRSVLQSMRCGAMRTAQARHWAVLLWSLAKVGAPATEVEQVLEDIEADVAVCGPMATGLCNAQDISNTLWAVAEGGYTSMHAPVLNAAAQGLQVNNVLLATPTSVAPANSTQSLQAAANTAWAVQQILSSSSSSSSSSKHKQRQQLDAGLQEVALQVAAYCAAALKGPLLSHYTHVTDIKGTGVFSADGTGEEKACTGNEEGSIRELGLKSEAVRAAPASVLSAGAEGAGILGTGAVVPAATAAAAAGATTATAATAAAAAGATTAIAAAAAGAAASAAGAPPAGGAGAAATSAGATAGMAGVPMGKDKRSPIQGVPALKKGWGSSACMGVCALANIGYYEMELWSLAVWVTLQEAAQQQRWHEPLGHARWEAREQQQQQQQEQQCQQQQWQQQQQQQQQLEQQQEQEQQGVDRDLGTSVAGALWACARVGHGLHGWHLSQGSPPLPSALPHAHTLQGRVYSDLLALMLLAGSQHGATDAPAPRSPQHSSSSSSNNSDSWAGRGEARSMQGSGDDMQASSGDGQASASHEQASSVYTQASARSVSMALFALAVLWPVLLAEEHRKESRESIDTHSTTSSSSISGGGNSCAFSASSSTQHALRNAAHGSPNVPSASSSLQQSALALFGAAAAHHPTHFSEPGLTQLQMAYMEVTESGLLSLEQLQAVGWLQPTAHLGIPPTHAPISHSPTSCSATETQPEALLLPRHTEARTGGLPGEARDLAGALAPSLAAGAVSGGQSRLTHMVHQHGGLPGVASDTVEALEPSLAADAVSGGQSQVTHVVHQHGSLPDVARDTVGALAPSLATDAVSGGQSQVTHVVHQHGGLPDVARDTVEALEPSLAADAVSGGKSQVTHVVHQHGGLPDVARDTVEALAPSLAADAVSGGQSQVTHVVHQHGCAVAQAAAAAWQASQGSDVELEYALPLGNMNTPSKKSTTTTAAASNSSPEDNNNVGASWSVHPIAGLPAGTEGGGTDRLLMAKGEGAPTARSGRPSAEIACGPESARDDDDASFSADERQWRLQVSRSQQEVAEVLRSMGCQGIQVEGPTQNQSMRVDIMLPSMDPALFVPYLTASSSPESWPAQEGHAVCSSPQSFGSVAIEFNGPDHYLAVPAHTPTGSTLLRRRQLQRHAQVVVSIPWWEWAALQNSGREKEHYLAELILDGMKTESCSEVSSNL